MSGAGGWGPPQPPSGWGAPAGGWGPPTGAPLPPPPLPPPPLPGRGPDPRRAARVVFALVSIVVVAAIAGGAWWAYQRVKDDPVASAGGTSGGSDAGPAVPSGPLPLHPRSELRAVCEGRGDPRFDPYVPGVTATSQAPREGGLPPKVIHPGAEVHSQSIGAFVADGSFVDDMWNGYDAAEPKGIQLVACIAQLDAAQMVDCEQGGRQYPAANFRLTLRVANTGAEVTTFAFFSGPSTSCFHGAPYTLDPNGLTSPNVYAPAELSKAWVEPGA